MFVDASVLTAILAGENDARALAARLQARPVRVTSALAIWETVLAMSRSLDLTVSEARFEVERYLRLMDIEVVAIPPEAAGFAIDAFERYGKGRHPARLNMGDCFAYAGARLARVPLLYKGNDFALTDIDAA